MSCPAQNDRVLAALRNKPITAADFMPPTIDGGKPIMRLAARIKVLRDRGHNILTETVDGSPLASYRLISEALATAERETEPPAPDVLVSAGRLFDLDSCQQAAMGARV